MSLADNLVSAWHLDEASGNATDSFGSNTLTATNSPGATTGKLGGARTFAAASSRYFTIADNASLSSGDIDFTLAAWVQLSSGGTDRNIIGKFDATGNNREYRLIYAGGTGLFTFAVSSDGSGTAGSVTASTFGAVPTNTWCFVVGWHDSVNNLVGISVNAGTANTTSYSSGVSDKASAFQIGARGGATEFWDGNIDEVIMWKRVLSSAERTQLYNSGNGLAYPWSTFKAAWARGSNVLMGMK